MNMVRKTQIYFKLAKMVTDSVSVALALFLAQNAGMELWQYGFAGLFVVILMGFFGGYRLGMPMKFSESLIRAFIAVSFSAIGTLYLFSENVYAVNELLRIFTLGFIYLIILRVIVEQFELKSYRLGVGQIPIVLVGMSKAGERLLEKYAHEDFLGKLNIIGFLDNNRKDPVAGVTYLGKLIDLESRIEAYKPEAVIQVGHLEQAVTITAICQKYNLDYHVLPSLIGAFGTKVSINDLIGFPLLSVKETNLEGWGFFFKRVFDLSVASLLIVLLSPIFLIIAIAIMVERKDSKFLVSEKRIDGRMGREFDIYRFRTLIDSASERPLEEHEIKLHSHGEIVDKSLEETTKLGRFLRVAELNELPQLFNVINNSMSLVGPRPPFKEELKFYTNFHQKRLRLKPGLTGMWQVDKESTDGTHDSMLKVDIAYVENWSMGLDFRIIVKTVIYVLRKLSSFT